MATKGQYAEFSFEQGWGTFTWSKFDAEGRTYFTTGSRPDGTGKRFFTSAATSASPRRASRSTSGSSPATSAASAASSTAPSARTPWACRSAAS